MQTLALLVCGIVCAENFMEPEGDTESTLTFDATPWGVVAAYSRQKADWCWGAEVTMTDGRKVDVYGPEMVGSDGSTWRFGFYIMGFMGWPIMVTVNNPDDILSVKGC